MPGPIQITDSQVRAILAAADAAGGEVVLPAGDLLVTRPVKITRSAIVRGMGAGVTRFVQPAGVSMPAVVCVHPNYDTCPVVDGVLRPLPDGGFLDLGLRHQGAQFRFLFDIAFTLDSLPPDGTEHALASSRSSLDNVAAAIPFELTVMGPTLTLRVGGAVAWQGPGLTTGRQRVVYQHTDDLGTVLLWRVDAAGSPTLLYAGSGFGRNVWPDYCPLMVGRPTVRWPESTALLPACPGLAIHQIAHYPAAAWSEEVPPTGPDVVGDLAPRVDFATAEIDGCLIRGEQNGLPSWLLWRSGVGGDEHNLSVHLRDFSVAGNGLGLAGVWVAGAHDWSAEGLTVKQCRYGLIATGQSYQSQVCGFFAETCHAGLVFTNNSGLTTVTSPHIGSGNLYGLVVSDSGSVTVIGGWSVNNNRMNVLVKGDITSVSTVGFGCGFEGGTAAKNVLLSGVVQATFTGGGFLTHGSPIPQVECVGSGRILFVAPRFGPHPDCEGSILVTDHDPNHQVEVVGQAAIWPAVPGQAAPPLMHPDSTYRPA